MSVYKILTSAEWGAFDRDGRFEGSEVDARDGYIHLSAADQVRETARKHFSGQDGLRLLAIDSDRLSPDLRWEPSRGGALFPHLYRPLRREDVDWTQPLPWDAAAERHQFPEGVSED